MAEETVAAYDACIAVKDTPAATCLASHSVSDNVEYHAAAQVTNIMPARPSAAVLMPCLGSVQESFAHKGSCLTSGAEIMCEVCDCPYALNPSCCSAFHMLGAD